MVVVEVEMVLDFELEQEIQLVVMVKGYYCLSVLTYLLIYSIDF